MPSTPQQRRARYAERKDQINSKRRARLLADPAFAAERAAKRRADYQKHRQTRLNTTGKYYREHREAILAHHKQYNLDHAEEIKAKRKARVAANRERLSLKNKEYKQRRREQEQEQRLGRRKED